MDAHELQSMSAVAAVAALRNGEIRSSELVGACLERIAVREADVRAFVHLDESHARAQAEQLDALRASGEPPGPLHGLPVGIKDIFDTADYPTENGSPIHAGRQPVADAAAVSRLRAAGAVILGKTVTTEFATYHPGKTRNPRALDRTPGGSSSGSAAAVADSMVPLAIGSQTNGSVIRPAAFCGVYGYKPTHGLISRARTMLLSRTLDHVGVFARTLTDVALIADVLAGHDEEDPDTHLAAPPRLGEALASQPPVGPRLALVPTPVWPRMDAATHGAFDELAERLGDAVARVELPPEFEQAYPWHTTVMQTQMAWNLRREYEHSRERLSPRLRDMIEQGRAATAFECQRALEGREQLYALLLEIFEDYDAIITPAALGEAPSGIEATGDPACCTLWTFCGTPAVSLPLLRGPAGLPVGVQLVGARRDDARLLRTARWLETTLERSARES